MQTYVETLLHRQLQQAARFSVQQGLELRQYGIFAALAQEQAIQTEQAAEQTELCPPDQAEQAGAAQVLRLLDTMQAANARAQAADLTRQAGAARQAENGAAAFGWKSGPAQVQTAAGGISEGILPDAVALYLTERSMREISRYFERDSRRYG